MFKGWSYIEADFLSHYGLRLVREMREGISYREFMVLFKSLPPNGAFHMFLERRPPKPLSAVEAQRRGEEMVDYLVAVSRHNVE